MHYVLYGYILGVSLEENPDLSAPKMLNYADSAPNTNMQGQRYVN